MYSTLPEFLESRPQASLKPTPPTRVMLESLRRPALETSFPAASLEAAPPKEIPRPKEPSTPAKRPLSPERNPFLRFEFKRPFPGEYTTKDYKFVLRIEHFPELMRLVNEFNKTKPADEFPIGVSDIVTAALDFVLEHPIMLTGLQRPEDIREAMAQATYHKAFFRFKQLYELFWTEHAL